MATNILKAVYSTLKEGEMELDSIFDGVYNVEYELPDFETCDVGETYNGNLFVNLQEPIRLIIDLNTYPHLHKTIAERTFFLTAHSLSQQFEKFHIAFDVGGGDNFKFTFINHDED